MRLFLSLEENDWITIKELLVKYKLKQKIKFTDNATIVSRDVKETRNTIEEITEKEYNKKIGNKKNTTIKLSEVK